MLSFFSAMYSNPFLQMALCTAILASIASGLTGPYIVTKKMASISGSLAHTILGGIGLFLFLKYECHMAFADPIYGAFLAAILSALVMGWIHQKYPHKEDMILAAIWSSGMAIGVLFVSAIHGYQGDFSDYLFGNILMVAPKHLLLLGLLDLLIGIVIFFFYYPFLAICFDEEQTFLQGLSVSKLYIFLLLLISLSIVLLLEVLGVILCIALLTIPATIASLFTYRLRWILLWSIVISLFCNFLGIFISYTLDISPGATIALTAAALYLLALLTKKKFFLLMKKNRQLS
ncbi:MAG: metal ABC transporter permease [Chlamydiota bacterium]